MKDNDKYQSSRKNKTKTNHPFLNGVITTLVIQVAILVVYKYFQTHTVADVVATVQALITTVRGV